MKLTGLVCVDGCDGCGKTSLAQALVKKNGGGLILHQTYRWKNKMFTFHTAALHRAVKLAKTELVILDRLWMSEAIYGAVFRNGTKWPHEGRMMDRILLKHAAIYVICSGDPTLVAKRHAELKQTRHELFDHNIEKVAARFNQLYYGRGTESTDYVHHLSRHGMRSRSDTLYYSIEREGQNVPDFCEKVLESLYCHQQRQYSPALSNDDHNVLGHISSARTLFVGDEVNPKSLSLRWPFYDYGNSSLFLSEKLHQIKFDETEGMWTNANNAPEHVRPILENKPTLKIIALGNNAEKQLNFLKIRPTAVIPHPQWAKRFNPNGDYHHQLARAILA